MEKMLLTVQEVAQALNTSRWRVFELIRTRQLRSLKLGASRRVPIDAIHSFIQEQQEEAMY